MCQLSNRFFSAVRTLSGDGSVKQRLARAYHDHLELLTDNDIPDAIRPEFEALRRAMHSVKPMHRESPVTASVRKMSADEASRHCTTIVSMFSALVRVKTTGESLSTKTRNATERAAKSPRRRSHRLALN